MSALTPAEQAALDRLTHERRYDLVLQGGGVKGVALAGALSELESRGYRPQRLAGTSAGAVVAVLYAAGYTAGELRDLILAPDFRALADLTPLARVPLVGGLLSILLLLGQCEGAALERWLMERLAAKGVRTFADLRQIHPEGSVQVIVTDLTARALLVLPDDAPALGLDPDALEVAQAVRMSAGIPFYYRPVVRRAPDGRRHWLVDGGVLSNFPVWLFDVPAPGLPRWPTFGLRLAGEAPAGDSVLSRSRRANIVQYLSALVSSMLEARDRYALARADYARSVDLPTLGVGTTEFDLAPERAAALFEAGRAATARFLDGWDFPAYLAAYRLGSGVAEVARRYAGQVS